MISDRTVAKAQIALSFVFMIGYFIMFALFLLGYIRTPTEWRDQLSILLGVLTAGVTNILAYWFARQRPDQSRFGQSEPENSPHESRRN